MDGSDRSSDSSSSRKLSVNFSDENDQSYQEMGLTLTKSKKPLPSPKAKNFMSPTISAASKAITSRKKILAERNETFDTEIHKSPITNPKYMPGDSSSRPYDPSTNYLSPRPQFLRYKPLKRREILLRCENGVKNGEESLSSSEEGSVKEDCKEQDEYKEEEAEEEEEEEEEEERCGFLRRVLELMILMFVLVFITMYVSSMNSPASYSSLPALEAMEGFKEGFLKIQDQVLESMRNLGGEDHGFLYNKRFEEILRVFNGGGGSGVLDGKLGLMKLNQTITDEASENENLDVKNVHMEKMEEMCDDLSQIEDVDKGDMAEIQGGENEDVYDNQIVEAEEDDCDEAVEDIEISLAEEDDFDKRVEDLETEEEESVENVESLQDKEEENDSNKNDCEQESEIVLEPTQEDENMNRTQEMEELENTFGRDDRVFILERTENEITKLEVFESEADDGGRIEVERLVEQIETIIVNCAIGASVFLATLALVLYLKKKINNAIKHSPSLVTEPCNDDDDQPSSLVKNEEDTFESPVSSMKKNITVEDEEHSEEGKSQTRAPPAIELLGEFDFGEMSGSRSLRTKRKMAESEVSSGGHSVSLGKEFKRKVVISAQPELSDCSAMNSYSHGGGFDTPEKKKIQKKQEVGDAKKAVLTPLRRSSRVRRSRAITSP